MQKRFLGRFQRGENHSTASETGQESEDGHRPDGGELWHVAPDPRGNISMTAASFSSTLSGVSAVSEIVVASHYAGSNGADQREKEADEQTEGVDGKKCDQGECHSSRSSIGYAYRDHIVGGAGQRSTRKAGFNPYDQSEWTNQRGFPIR